MGFGINNLVKPGNTKSEPTAGEVKHEKLARHVELGRLKTENETLLRQ